jgi:hypothetical protein
MPFLGITLLPFTDEQRERFIRGWFSTPGDRRVSLILNHLSGSPQVAELVRNPLLATILCVLAEHEVPLPDTEVRLYEERFRLLLGEYDVYKGTTRLRSRRQVLERVARRLAYRIHLKEARQAQPDLLKKLAVQDLQRRFPARQIEMAVDELMSPCNVLVPMSEDGQVGFGHLRYQEFLAACELRQNRGVDLMPFLSRPWWRDTLKLFAQMTDDIEFVVESLMRECVTADEENALREMIGARPKRERQVLSETAAMLATEDVDGSELEDYV